MGYCLSVTQWQDIHCLRGIRKECQASWLLGMHYLLNFGNSVFLRGASSTPKIGLMSIAIHPSGVFIGMLFCSVVGNVDLGGDVFVEEGGDGFGCRRVG
jgi:hypothetical protein